MRRQIIPYDPQLRERARELRRQMTLTEVLLWRHLKNGQIRGFDFHRQKPILSYIADFYSPDLLLAIEIDGGSHSDRASVDDDRDRRLEPYGIVTLRFTAKEIELDAHGVAKAIDRWIAQRLQTTPALAATSHRGT